MQSVTVEEIGSEYPSLTGPSETDDGLMQLSPATVLVTDGVIDAAAEAVTDGVIVLVGEAVTDGEGVVVGDVPVVTDVEGDGIVPGR